MAPQHDPKFYFEPPRILTFQVENTLFRLPVRPLISVSLVFKDMLGLPNVNQEGLSDEVPIVIADESVETFRRVLEWIFSQPSAHYTFGGGKIGMPEFTIQSKDESLRLFHFSRKFQMEQLETLCSADLKNCREWKPMDRIRFSSEYNLGCGWAAQGYKDLAAETNCLSIYNARQMGVETFALVVYIQHKARNWSRDGCPCYPQTYTYDYVNLGSRKCSCASRVPIEKIVIWIQEAQSQQ